MKQKFPHMRQEESRVPMALTALALLFALSASRAASAQAATWTTDDALHAYDAYASQTYFFYNGRDAHHWSDPQGNGEEYSIIVDQKSDKKDEKAWHTFWQEAEKIELAEDAYYRAAEKKDDELKKRYRDQVDALCQGFIDRMDPVSNFGHGAPWEPGHHIEDAYDWHGSGFADTDYSSQKNPKATSSGPGDWFNDDLMWAAIAFTRAHQITGKSAWLSAAENQVDYVWANAQAQLKTKEKSTELMEVGLTQTFCNKNGGKDGDCKPPGSQKARYELP
jgi:hypothetical protein